MRTWLKVNWWLAHVWGFAVAVDAASVSLGQLWPAYQHWGEFMPPAVAYEMVLAEAVLVGGYLLVTLVAAIKTGVHP